MDDVTATAPAPAAAAGKKRKAEDAAPVAAKKAKQDGAGAGGVSNIFVGSLSWNVDDDWLRTEFEKFGEVNSAKVITDRDSGRSRGCVKTQTLIFFGSVLTQHFIDSVTSTLPTPTTPPRPSPR